jgi:type IV secretion system protein TrbG
MIRLLLAGSALALIAACATPAAQIMPDEMSPFIAASEVEETVERPVEIVSVAEALPLPGQLKPVSGALAGQTAEEQEPAPPIAPEAAIEQGRKSALIEPSVDGYVNAIQVYPFTEGALYRLYASPGQVSDIALQPGEQLVSVSAGDTVRWVVGDTVSGAGRTARAHVLVKPISAGIHTNLMIASDRRVYHLELESTGDGYMAALSWRYPQDDLMDRIARNERARSREDNTVGTGVTLEGMDFNYTLSGDTPDWAPLRVFDDGRQVFIQMPDDIATHDLPPLFVLGESGKAELVNYRVKANYYIVDRLFRAAELRLGEKRQTVVRITKTGKRSGFAALFGG